MDKGIHIQVDFRRGAFSLKADLQLPGRGVTVLYGPSGCGKTSLLRILAGLDRVQGSLVTLGDQVWQKDQSFLPVHQRPLGYVFQEPRLFPHLTVAKNLTYGLMRRPKASEALLDRAVELLGIGPLTGRKPHNLSGGEQQRVSIARALASGPEILLMDEPLASLDPGRKQEVLPFLENLHRELEIPVIYVTHSPEELTRLADTLVVFRPPRDILQGPAGDILAGPESPLNTREEASVVVMGHIAAKEEPWNLVRVNIPGGHLDIRDPSLPLGASLRLRILARDVSLSHTCPEGLSILNHLPVTLKDFYPDEHPALVLAVLDLGGTPLLARVTRKAVETLGLQVNARLWAQVKSAALVG